ncbi:unnamed protein product, partial [Ixodes persulcatus]
MFSWHKCSDRKYFKELHYHTCTSNNAALNLRWSIHDVQLPGELNSLNPPFPTAIVAAQTHTRKLSRRNQQMFLAGKFSPSEWHVFFPKRAFYPNSAPKPPVLNSRHIPMDDLAA